MHYTRKAGLDYHEGYYFVTVSIAWRPAADNLTKKRLADFAYRLAICYTMKGWNLCGGS